MRGHVRTVAVLTSLVLSAGLVVASTVRPLKRVTPPEPTPVSAAPGEEAWSRIHEVVSHPRCLNCHVGPDNIPLWSDNTSARDRIHGMHIDAGVSRIGAETLPCSTCHQTSARPNTVPHAAPHAGVAWQLAPTSMQWVGKSSAEICAQLRDPRRNGGRDRAALVEHIRHDAEVRGFISWGFNPGPDREPAPRSMDDHLLDMQTWTAAGMPCPVQ